MSPETEAVRTTMSHEGASAEFIAFNELVGVLLSVSRAELQRKLQGDAVEPGDESGAMAGEA